MKKSNEDAYDRALDMLGSPEMVPHEAAALKNVLDTEWLDDFSQPDKNMIGSLLSIAKKGGPDAGRAYERATERMIEHFGDRADFDEMFMDVMRDHGVMGMALGKAQKLVGKAWGPEYGGSQRQKLSMPGEYFETMLRMSPDEARSFGLGSSATTDLSAEGKIHFANPGQLGHIRGSVLPESPLHGNTMVLDELQSDTTRLGSLGDLDVNVPGLDRVYGKLGRMALDRGAEAQLDAVLFPSAGRIASARGAQSPRKFYDQIYDRQLPKDLFEPLSARGVPIRMQDGWARVELPENVRRAIRESTGILNYKRGGLAQLQASNGRR